jgi:hypothetical protein
MHFEYEITVDEYVASQLLYHKLRYRRGPAERAIWWILVGSFFIVIGWSERVLNWAPTLLVAVGAWWIYAGVATLFPARYFRRAYQRADLAGKKFKADVNEGSFEVIGDLCTWRVQWPGVRLKNENERVFNALFTRHDFHVRKEVSE